MVNIQDEECDKMIIYDKMFETMKAKGITQYTLIKKYGFSPGQLTRIKKNNNINTHTVNMLCEILNCNVEDIMTYVPTQNTTKRG